MNNAHIDFLLQLPIARPEPASSPARPRHDAPAFDNHFRQASDAGASSASPAPPSRRSESATSDAERRPPAHEGPSGQSASAAESKNSSESTSPAPSTASAEVANVSDDERDRDETQSDESAEVAAVLAAAEQLRRAAGADAAVTEESPTDAEPSDVELVDPAAEPDQDPSLAERGAARSATSAKAEANVDIAYAGEVDANSPAESATGKPERDNKEVQAVAREIAPDAPDESAQLTDTAVEADGDSPHVTTKAQIHDDDGSHEKVTASDAGDKPSASHLTSATQTDEESAASTISRPEHAGDDAPERSNKKSTARTSAAVNKATLPPGEPTAAVAPAADGSGTAAHSQQPLPTGAAAPAASNGATAQPKDAAVETKNSPLSPFARLDHSARGSHRAGHGEGAPHVDPARFVSRVARAIQTAQERGGPLHLRLSPPELGAMRLEISINHGGLTATIETDNSTARQLLLDNLPALRDRLAEQNVKIERFDVDVRRDPSGGQQNSGPEDRNSGQRQDRASDRHGAARRETVAQSVDEALPNHRSITNTSINVVA